MGGGSATSSGATKRECGKKCVDAYDECDKKCLVGGTLDRKCRFDCEQERNNCVRPCQQLR
jgi:hypothetical protein